MASHRAEGFDYSPGLAAQREQNQGPDVILSASRSRLDLERACEEVTEGAQGTPTTRRG